MARHRKSHKKLYGKRHKKTRKNFRGGANTDIISVMKSLIPQNHTVSMKTGSGMPTPASTKNPFTKGGSKYKSRKQKGGLAQHASNKVWVCRGNIGCARNINIY